MLGLYNLLEGGHPAALHPQSVDPRDAQINAFVERFENIMSNKLRARNLNALLTREMQFRLLFEAPFLKLLQQMVNSKVKGLRITFLQELVLKKYQQQCGPHEAVDAAVIMELPNGPRYIIGLICCNANSTELNAHAPKQAIAYLIKAFHPQVGPEAVMPIILNTFSHITGTLPNGPASVLHADVCANRCAIGDIPGARSYPIFQCLNIEQPGGPK